MAHGRSNHMLPFLVVGLGMILIATLSGVVLWAITKRKGAGSLRSVDADVLGTSETAEA